VQCLWPLTAARLQGADWVLSAPDWLCAWRCGPGLFEAGGRCVPDSVRLWGLLALLVLPAGAVLCICVRRGGCAVLPCCRDVVEVVGPSAEGAAECGQAAGEGALADKLTPGMEMEEATAVGWSTKVEAMEQGLGRRGATEAALKPLAVRADAPWERVSLPGTPESGDARFCLAGGANRPRSRETSAPPSASVSPARPPARPLDVGATGRSPKLSQLKSLPPSRRRGGSGDGAPPP